MRPSSRFRSRDVVRSRPQREHLAYGFTVTRLPTGFEEDRWELKDVGGRTIARGTAVDWRDTRRLAEIALRRHLQKTGTERDVSPRQSTFIREKIPVLIDEGYPQRQAIAIAYRMAGVPPRGDGRRTASERDGDDFDDLRPRRVTIDGRRYKRVNGVWSLERPSSRPSSHGNSRGGSRSSSRGRNSSSGGSRAKRGVRVGDVVEFGRRNGEKTRARVVSVAQKTVLVELLERRGKGRSSAIGSRWRIPLDARFLRVVAQGKKDAASRGKKNRAPATHTPRKRSTSRSRTGERGRRLFGPAWDNMTEDERFEIMAEARAS